MTWSRFVWRKIESNDWLMWKCHWSVRCNKTMEMWLDKRLLASEKIILHEVSNTIRGKNSLDDEGANVVICRQFMNRKAIGQFWPLWMSLWHSNCALPPSSDALICWLQPKPSLSEEPSWGPKQRHNTQAVLEVILWTVAAEGRDGRKKRTFGMRWARG